MKNTNEVEKKAFHRLNIKRKLYSKTFMKNINEFEDEIFDDVRNLLVTIS